jgi:hypothetical protein
MSCFANIKSPSLGGTVTSPAYYQLTTFFPQQVGKSIYEGMTTTAFKVDLGFDWTKTQYGRSMKTNRHGEPNIHTMNHLLNLKLTEQQIRAGEQMEEFEAEGYLNVGFNNPQAFELIEGEVNLNPKYQDVETEVIQRDGKYYINVKPITGVKAQKPVSKNFLKRVGFSPLLINSVNEFSNANLTELMDSLINSPEVEEHQKEILVRLRRLMRINPTLKLTVFDDTVVDETFQRSFYNPKNNTVYIGKTLNSKFGTKEFVRDLIHETVHAYTISAINNPRTPQESLFKMEMIKHYNDYKNAFLHTNNYYGLTNVEEFVAEFMSNPYFRETLKERQEDMVNKKGFVASVFASIRNFFSGIFGVKPQERTPKFYQVEKTINDYLNYLDTLQDMPDHVAEHHIRFNDTYAQRDANMYAKRDKDFEAFYKFVDDSLKSSSWKQLAQAMNELDPKLISIQELKKRFGNLSIADTKDVINGSVAYMKSILSITEKLITQADEYADNSIEFEADYIVKLFNYKLSVVELLQQQLQGFNETLLPSLNGSLTFSEEYKADPEKLAKEREALRRKMPEIDSFIADINGLSRNLEQKLTTLKRISKDKLISGAAAQVAPYFKLMVEKANAEDSQINQEIAALEREIEILKTREVSKLEKVQEKLRITTKRKEFEEKLAKLREFQSFVPTRENIIKLFKEATESRKTSTLGRFFAIGNMTGVPQVDIIKQFIDVHITEAENESLRIREKVSKLNDKISAFNKKRSSLANFGGFGEYFKGFTRQVEMVYYDENGQRRVVKQTAYQTKFKEAEFHNDLEDLKAAVDKARASGDPTAIDVAESNLQKFIDDYALRPYTDEYYEAEALLTDKARNAREELLNQINSIEDIFGDEDFLGDGEVSTRVAKKELLKEFERLGSIYNIDGTEKPVGSEEREIAESIIAYKKKRKELSILEYVIPDNVMKRFEIKKRTFKNKVNKLTSDVQKLQEKVNEAELVEENAEKAATLKKELEEAKRQLKNSIEERDKWLQENTRVEIKPEFFELQRAIAEQIKGILDKYNQEARLPELYQMLFSSVKGYRDQDGVVVGNEIGEGLTTTIRNIEQEMEDIKGIIRREREITPEDKASLKNLFKRLNDLQTKKTTEYYQDTVAEIKNQIRSQIVADADFIEQLKEFAKQEAIRQLEDPLDPDAINKHLTTKQDEVFEDRLSLAIEERYKQTDWYKNNHVRVDLSVVDEFGQVEEKYEMRPIYIWQQTVPKNPKYIAAESPNFSWYTPRIRDAFRVRDARFMGEFRPRETQDRKYTNEEYEKMSREQPELTALVDEMVGLYEELQAKLPVSQRNKGYTIINKAKDSREKFYDVMTLRLRRGFNTYTSFDAFKTFFSSNVQSSAEENVEEIEDDILTAGKEAAKKKLGKPRLIKTRYKVPLSTDAVSDDLLGALSSFGIYVSEFEGLKKAMPAVFSLRDAVAEKRDAEDAELGMIDDQINRFFYGGENISATKGWASTYLGKKIIRIWKKIFSYSQARVLQFNPLRVPKNIITNNLRTILNAKAFGLSRKRVLLNILKGYFASSSLFSLRANNRKLNKKAMTMAYFRAIPSADPTTLASKVHQNGVYKFMNMHTLQATTFGFLEDASTISIYYSIMERTTVPVIINGQTTHIKIEDAYDYVDGALEVKDGVFGIDVAGYKEALANKASTLETFLVSNGVQTREQLSAQNRIKYDNLVKKLDAAIAAVESKNKEGRQKLQNTEQYVRDQIHKMYTSTQGAYFKRSRSKYENHILLGFLMSMKRWLFPSLQNFYGSKRFSVNTGTLDRGFYSELAAQLGRNLKYLIFQEGLTFGKTQHQKERLARTAWDTGISLGLHALSASFVGYALSALVASLGGGDEDDPYWSILFAIMLLGTYDEYTSVHPIIGPANFYIKTFEQKPLQKYGAEETPLESGVRHGANVLFGQQARSLTDMYDALDMLSEGKLTDPYVEQYSDKYQIRNNASMFEGLPLWQAAGLKFIGFEAGAKPFGDPAKRLLTELKYKPMIGIPNPIGEVTLIDKRMDEIKDVFKREPELMSKLNEIKDFNMVKKKGGSVLYPDMNSAEAKAYIQAAKAISGERGKELLNFYVEYFTLKVRKELIVNSFAPMRDAEERKAAAQYMGQLTAAQLKSVEKDVFGGTVKEYLKIKPSKELENIKARERLYQDIEEEIVTRSIKINQKPFVDAMSGLIKETQKDILNSPDIPIIDFQGMYD